jgi:preprotein translocase subunit SecE
VARNRKRAKERRAQRPQAVAYRGEREDSRGALDEREDRRPLGELEQDDARRGRDGRDQLADLEHGEEPGDSEEDQTPGPMVHATPDVELAEAQLAVGRPELDRESDSSLEDGSELEDESEPDDGYQTGVEDEYDTGVEDEYEVEDSEAEDQALEPDAAGARGRRGDAGFDGEPTPGRRGELVAPAGGIGRRALPGNRVVNFLQGSWRELQRVQWPDRRQVMQATAVVIGFVIVAGVFLGVADFLAGKLVNYILK